MEIIFIIAVLIFSIVIHEVAHASVANSLGDPTARQAGRLTLNPIKHLDLMGSLIVPLFLVIMRAPFLFGWAKPVPINPYNFTDQKYGQLKVSLAGPSANFLVAVFFGVIARFLPLATGIKESISHQFLSPSVPMIEVGFWGLIFQLFFFIIFINILLAIFNLLPMPPLDGSHVLFTFFPVLEQKMISFYAKTGFIGFFIIIFLIFQLAPFIFPLVRGLSELIAGV